MGIKNCYTGTFTFVTGERGPRRPGGVPNILSQVVAPTQLLFRSSHYTLAAAIGESHQVCLLTVIEIADIWTCPLCKSEVSFPNHNLVLNKQRLEKETSHTSHLL